MTNCLMHEEDEELPLTRKQSFLLWQGMIAGTALDAYLLWMVVKWLWRVL